jgi:hypothetical protein
MSDRKYVLVVIRYLSRKYSIESRGIVVHLITSSEIWHKSKIPAVVEIGPVLLTQLPTWANPRGSISFNVTFPKTQS